MIDTPQLVVDRPPPVALLATISPSRFASARECALREAYAAGRTQGLLPRSPAARLGTVIHRLLEAASRGEVGLGEGEIAERWDELVEHADRGMLSSVLEAHLAPLSLAVADYQVRRIRAIRIAAELASARQEHDLKADEGTAMYGPELPVASASGKVEGRIDAVIPTASGPVIRDYKSGLVFDEDGEVAEAYATQLRLYAALYASTLLRWPAALEVVPLSGGPVAVDFVQDDCRQLVEDAEGLLEQMNATIAGAPDASSLQASLASPASATCRFCPYRPACSPYLEYLVSTPSEGPVSDVIGRASSTQQLGNGRYLLVVTTASGEVRVRGLDAARHPSLRDLGSGTSVGIFGARIDRSPNSFVQGPATTVYILEGAFERYGGPSS